MIMNLTMETEISAREVCFFHIVATIVDKTVKKLPHPSPHQCCSAAEQKAGSSSGLQSNIELGGGGSEGLLLSKWCFL